MVRLSASESCTAESGLAGRGEVDFMQPSASARDKRVNDCGYQNQTSLFHHLTSISLPCEHTRRPRHIVDNTTSAQEGKIALTAHESHEVQNRLRSLSDPRLCSVLFFRWWTTHDLLTAPDLLCSGTSHTKINNVKILQWNYHPRDHLALQRPVLA